MKRKFWNIHKIMLIILTTILVFGCSRKVSNMELVNEFIEKCDSHGGYKIISTRAIKTQKNYKIINFKYIICNDGTKFINHTRYKNEN